MPKLLIIFFLLTSFSFCVKAQVVTEFWTRDTWLNDTVINQAPFAYAGVDRAITLPVNSLTLTGYGIDYDGIIVSYKWVQISGPAAATIVDSDSAITDINDLIAGRYVFTFVVTDSTGLTGTDDIEVIVNPSINELPIADAGANITVTLPTDTAFLAGSGTDTDGSISSYAWVKISGPAGGTISAASSAGTHISALIEGIYQYELTVTDNSGGTATDLVDVIVNQAAPVNQPPIANAGNNIIINL